MKGQYLGEFEEMLLLLVAILEKDAYGVNIQRELKEKADRETGLSAIHITLYRLEDKGFVSSYLGEATAVRGGRRKRVFELTHAGHAALEEAREKRAKLWNLYPGFNA